jgi:hypothetical protein
LPEIRTGWLGKWRAQLTDADMDAIRGVVGFGPPKALTTDSPT